MDLSLAQDLESHLKAQSERGQRLFWHRLRWDAVRRHLPATPGVLLDVGAGAGHLARYVAADRPSLRYAFIEPLDSLRNELRARHGAAADFADRAQFDDVGYVTLLDVLEHQQDDADFLRKLAARMSAGTKLILTVPALPLLWSGWDVGLGHHRRYVKGELRHVVQRAGFDLVELSYLFPELIPSALYRRFALSSRSDAAPELELPEPSAPVNEALYAVGWVSQKLRRLHLAGTSLIAVATRR